MRILRAREAVSDRLNCMFVGLPGSGKTHLALDFPSPALVDFEDGYLTAVLEGYDIPILKPETWEDVLYILEAPELVIKDIQTTDGFSEYDVKTWIFDSVSTMQTTLMGRAFSPANGDTPAKPGKGILGVARNRTAPNTPSIEDYKDLMQKVTAFFNMVRQLPYHTVINAHAGMAKTPDSPRGLNVDQSLVKYSGYPILTGDLKYYGGGLTDVFVYLEHTTSDKYFAHTKSVGQWNARTRMAQLLERRIENPTFKHFHEPLKNALGGKE